MDRYQPPTAPLMAPPFGAPVSPVAVGVVMGAGACYLAYSVTGMAFLWWLAATGTPTQQLYARVYASTPYMLFAHAMGIACCAMAGYWSTRASSTRGYAAAVYAALLFILFTAMQMMAPYPLPIPAWSMVLSLVLPLPGYLLGAWLFRRRMPASPN